MFLGKLPNGSGTISIQIISKRKGRYKVVEPVGPSRDPGKTEKLMIEAKNKIKHPPGQMVLMKFIKKTFSIKTALAPMLLSHNIKHLHLS